CQIVCQSNTNTILYELLSNYLLINRNQIEVHKEKAVLALSFGMMIFRLLRFHSVYKKKEIVNLKLLVFFSQFGFKISYNVLGLCDGGAIEARTFNFVLIFDRSTNVEFCSFAPLLQNPCYRLAFCRSLCP